jgi:hypothetical protein
MRIVWWFMCFFQTPPDPSAEPRKLADLRPGDLL